MAGHHKKLRLKSTILAISVGFLVGCTCQGPAGKTDSNASKDHADTPNTAAHTSGNATPSGDVSSEKDVTIGCAIYKYDDTFMASVRSAFNEAAKGKPHAKVSFVDGAGQQPLQNEKVELFLAKNVNVLAINPVDRTAAGVLIDKAKAASTPIVFFNREPLPEDMKKWDRVYYVGARAEESGVLEGQIIAEYWKSHPEADRNKDGILQYVMITGEPGHQDAELRTQFAIKAIEDAGIKTQKLAQDTGMWDRVKGQEKMAAMLGAHGDAIEAVLANNDDMALGAIEALKAGGYFQNGRYVPVVGVDATAPALRALADGTMLGTVLNDAKHQGQATFMLSYLLAQGQVPTKEALGFDITEGKYIWVPYRKIGKTNMNDAL